MKNRTNICDKNNKCCLDENDEKNACLHEMILVY